MSEIIFQNLIYDENAILNLYNENEWIAYINDKQSLFRGIKNSLDIIAAYDNGLLVGMIRTVGDRETIIYIQDILVLPQYQRRGIGTILLKRIIDKYKTVRQIVLATDNTIKTSKFYESIGMESYEKSDIVGFRVKK
jgi:ribosomal protein S18 acetylase RimI-like enzyme